MATPFHALKIAQQPPSQIGEDLALSKLTMPAFHNPPAATELLSILPQTNFNQRISLNVSASVQSMEESHQFRS
jgi:hypothetical protein